MDYKAVTIATSWLSRSIHPTLGPNRKGSLCTACHIQSTKISFGGGQVYIRPVWK